MYVIAATTFRIITGHTYVNAAIFRIITGHSYMIAVTFESSWHRQQYSKSSRGHFKVFVVLLWYLHNENKTQRIFPTIRYVVVCIRIHVHATYKQLILCIYPATIGHTMLYSAHMPLVCTTRSTHACHLRHTCHHGNNYIFQCIVHI